MRKFLINIKLFLCKLSISFDDELKIYNQWFNYQTVNKLTQEYCLILKFITIDDNFNYYVMSKLRDGLKDGKSLITKCKSRSPDIFDANHLFNMINLFNFYIKLLLSYNLNLVIKKKILWY